MITSFCVHECEGSSRMGSRPRRVLFTGHANGCVQIWDLSTALDLSNKAEPSFVGGPTPSELVRSLEQCEVVASRASTPAPTPHLLGAAGSASGTAGTFHPPGSKRLTCRCCCNCVRRMWIRLVKRKNSLKSERMKRMKTREVEQIDIYIFHF